MFNHILKLIRNSWRQNTLLLGGLFIISVCLWFAVDFLYSVAVNQRESLGFDWHHVYQLDIGALPTESERFDASEEHTTKGGSDLLTIVERLEQHSAVEAVCITHMHKHYVWMNQSTNVAVDSLKSSSYLRFITPEYFRVFRVKGADGASPETMTARGETNSIMLVKRTADRLFPNGDAVGRLVYENQANDSLRVSAVIENQKYNEYGSHQSAGYRFMEAQEIAHTHYLQIPRLGCYIRVKPEYDGSDFIHAFRKEMREQLKVGNLYLENVTPLWVIRDEHLKDYRNDLYTYMAVTLFFLLNTFLAILGTFWTRTRQRTSELALRLAVGSSKRTMVGILYGEAFLIVTIAWLLALVVAWNLGRLEVVETWPVPFTFERFVIGASITYLLLIATVAVSIYFPARQAMKIQPAEALHEE